MRAWSIVPAAVNERDVAADLLEVGPPPHDVLLDKGFAGRAFAAACAARGIAVLLPPTKAQRAGMPSALRKVIASWRNYIEVWQVCDRRYLSEGSMALLNRPQQSDEEVAQLALIAS